MKTLFKSLLLSGFLMVAPSAFAAQMYIDLGLGNSTVEIDEFEGSDTYLKIAVGGEVSEGFGWEGGFWDVGDAEDAGVTVSADGLFGNIKASHAINSDTKIFGKLGLFMWDGKACAGGDCLSDDGNDLFYGGGVTFEKVGPGSINLEILMSELGSDAGDFDVMTIGGSYSIPFGK
jgi:hypothetical protein